MTTGVKQGCAPCLRRSLRGFSYPKCARFHGTARVLIVFGSKAHAGQTLERRLNRQQKVLPAPPVELALSATSAKNVFHKGGPKTVP